MQLKFISCRFWHILPVLAAFPLNNRGTGFLGFGACPLYTVGDPWHEPQGWGKGGIRPCWLFSKWVSIPWPDSYMPLRSIWNDHKKWMVHLSQMGFEGFLPWDRACPCTRFGCHHGSVSTREHVFSFGHLLKVAWAKLLLSGSLSWKEASKNAQGRRKVFKAGLSGKARVASGLLAGERVMWSPYNYHLGRR